MLHEKKYPSAIVTFDHSYSSSNFTLRRISFINNINNSIFVPFGAEKKNNNNGDGDGNNKYRIARMLVAMLSQTMLR